uniref:Uncharacterized protein n=1 Tax=Rhizophora mucronata TaxID=61149 RepID=A0A2P2Q6B1_RHIMU
MLVHFDLLDVLMGIFLCISMYGVISFISTLSIKSMPASHPPILNSCDNIYIDDLILYNLDFW